jgi:hypothetical protein
MLKDIVKAKQVYYRQFYDFPNKITVNKAAYTELKAELKGDLKEKTLMPPQINGLALYINEDQKEPFVLDFDPELGPSIREIINANLD